ncbi:DCN1-like protein 3 [Bacillus rossius redtenbacheri]|uniref:DCN1-like protein 3 n=1 Tax=Bacillus rossius redtenbacheri TaxID=93214 RepID=UPI002FDE94FD
MGNCFSCFKVPPPADLSNNSSLDKGKDERELVNVIGSLEEPLHLPLTAGEQQANGNRNSVAGVGDSDTLPREKLTRPFYGRLPPLGRSAGGGEAKGKEASDAKLNALFEHYRDAGEDAMLADGIERFCADLALSPDEFRVLVLAWKFDAQQMCRFSRSEFVGGCRALRADTLRGIQSRLPELVAEVAGSPDLFKDLYRFTFRFGLDSECGQRILPAEMAVCLWRLVFSVREPAVLSRWLFFLETHPHVKGIPRDTWNMFLNFCEAVDEDLSLYDDTAAWPSLFDDFVEFENDQANQNISKDRDELIKQDCE